MRIIDAEPQLVQDILDELQVLDKHVRDRYTVHVGRHPLLGRMTIVSFPEEKGGGVIVEME